MPGTRTRALVDQEGSKVRVKQLATLERQEYGTFCNAAATVSAIANTRDFSVNAFRGVFMHSGSKDQDFHHSQSEPISDFLYSYSSKELSTSEIVHKEEKNF